MNKTLTKIMVTKKPEDLFDPKDQSDRKYRNLLRRAHPDMFTTPEDIADANKAFIYLNSLWEKYSNPTRNKTPTNTIKTKKHTFTVEEKMWEDGSFTTLKATYDAGYKTAYISIPGSPKDNDLFVNGGRALKKLKKTVPEKYRVYYPELLEAFRLSNNGKMLQALATTKPENLYSLKEVLEDYPEGISLKDLAWIFRRTLVAVGNANDAGIIHGGINLDSILIEPEMHGLLLTNWQYSVEEGEKLIATPIDSKHFYPKEILEGSAVDYKLDIRLAAETMLQLGGKQLNRPFNAFLKGCLVTSVPKASQLLKEFDELIEKLWGERTFHKFEMKRKTLR
jgi:hypothetical protein